MASSVSSERAFSSAGITISKRRNRLGADIIEALQGMKSLYRRDTLFREVITADLELAEDGDNALSVNESATSRGDEDPGSWDELVENIEDGIALEGESDDGEEAVYLANI